MPTRTANATWTGDLPSGAGTMSAGPFQNTPYSFASRFENGSGTNPEELIAAAHAGCYAMALSNILADAGHTPERVTTTATVHLEMLEDGGPTITTIDLAVEAEVPGLDADAFQEHAETAKVGCPVSKALAGPDITLDAKLA